MSHAYLKLPPERRVAYKKHGQGMEIVGKDVNLVKVWNNDHNSYCELCNKGGDLLLCDYCNVSLHPTCLSPPMTVIPDVLFV